jgi:DNA-binding MarR family transcriptional regulator
MRKNGQTFGEIADILGLDTSVVSRNFRKLEMQGPNPDFYAKPPIPGRPRKLLLHDERCAERAISSGKCRDATDVQRKLFPDLHPTTLRRMFVRKGLFGRIRWKKPWLSKKHISGRKLWAQQYRKRREFFWQKVWYSDESKFNLFGSDGKVYCRRRVGEALRPQNVKKTVKHGGGNVMVWGCISWHGPGRLHRVEGRMNAMQYVQILSESFLGSMEDRKVRRKNIIFQQDNDPNHTSKLAMKWFHENKITVLPWPASSPDQNIIEHVWDHIDRRIRARQVQPRNTDELWLILKEEWENMDLAYIRKLYNSIPRRIEALCGAKGCYTKY